MKILKKLLQKCTLGTLEAKKIDLSNYQQPKFNTDFEKGYNYAIDTLSK